MPGARSPLTPAPAGPLLGLGPCLGLGLGSWSWVLGLVTPSAAASGLRTIDIGVAAGWPPAPSATDTDGC